MNHIDELIRDFNGGKSIIEIVPQPHAQLCANLLAEISRLRAENEKLYTGNQNLIRNNDSLLKENEKLKSDLAARSNVVFKGWVEKTNIEALTNDACKAHALRVARFAGSFQFPVAVEVVEVIKHEGR